MQKLHIIIKIENCYKIKNQLFLNLYFKILNLSFYTWKQKEEDLSIVK